MEKKRMIIVVPDLKPAFKLEDRNSDSILAYVEKKEPFETLVVELNKSSNKYHILTLEAPSLRVCREVDMQTDTHDECDIEAKINVLCGKNKEKRHLLCDVSMSDDPAPVMKIQTIIKERLPMLKVIWAAIEGIPHYSMSMWLASCPEIFSYGADFSIVLEDTPEGKARAQQFRDFNIEKQTDNG